MKVSKLTYMQVSSFWQLFKEVLQSEFPGYSPKTIQYFLEKIYTEPTFRYYVRENLKTILVTTEGADITGFAVIDEPYGGVSLCRWLGIKKEHQKKGHGRALIDEWLKLAKLQNCHKVEVAAQPQAKVFYEKMGLDFEGKRARSYFGIDQYIFGKVIGDIDDTSMLS
jgi:ribosomal protein S18 acetylase RimI-like enzyme